MARPRCGVCLLVVLAVSGFAVEARGAAWSEPIGVTSLDRPALVRGAAIAGDEAVVAWEDYDVIGTDKATSVTNFAVWASAAPVGRGFGAPRLLGRARDDPWPSLASSASGWSALAWDADGAVEVAVRPPHGVFSQPIAVPGAQAVGGAKVGIDDAGTATVVWSELGTSLPFTSPIRSVTVSPDGAVSVPRTLGADASAGGPLFVAVGGRGDAVVAWTGYDGGALSRTRAALRPPGGDFGAVATFADPVAYLYPSGVVVDERGNATVAMERWRSDAPPALSGPGVLVVEGATTGGWGMPQALNGSTGVLNIQLVANARGDRAALWDVNPSDARQPGSAQVALAAAAAPFGAPIVTSMPWLTAGAITGDGETLVLSGDPPPGLEVHPFTAAGRAEPVERLLRDGCAGVGGAIAAGAASGLAAVAYQSDQDEVRVVYRGAGPPARPRRPRICSLTVTAAGAPRTLTMRLSSPVAHITIDVRRLAPHARLVIRRRMGARDPGDVRVTLRTLSPGRYRASARAVDAAGRRSAVATAAFRVTRRHRR